MMPDDGAGRSYRCPKCGTSVMPYQEPGFSTPVLVCTNPRCRSWWTQAAIVRLVKLAQRIAVGDYIRLAGGTSGWVVKASLSGIGVVFVLDVDPKSPAWQGPAHIVAFKAEDVGQIVRHDLERELDALELFGTDCDQRVAWPS